MHRADNDWLFLSSIVLLEADVTLSDVFQLVRQAVSVHMYSIYLLITTLRIIQTHRSISTKMKFVKVYR